MSTAAEDVRWQEEKDGGDLPFPIFFIFIFSLSLLISCHIYYVLLLLALTDLLVGLVAMPLNVDFHVSGSLWTHHNRVCVFWLLTDTVICTASVWTMVAIAVDRLMVI